MQDEISLGERGDQNPERPRRSTGIRYDKRGENYGFLRQDLFTVKDLAGAIGVNQTVISQAIRNNRLKAINLGGPAGYRIRRQDVLEWLENMVTGRDE